MRQYVTGIKKCRKIIQRIEKGLRKYADELRDISFIEDEYETTNSSDRYGGENTTHHFIKQNCCLFY